MQVQREACRLYAPAFYDRTSKASEFPGLRSDLTCLLRMASERQEAVASESVLRRMMRSYQTMSV